MRVSKRQLKNHVDHLNVMLGRPTASYSKRGGEYQANVGTFYLSHGLEGYDLCEIVNKHGGVRNPFRCGYVPARELNNRLAAFMDGIMLGWETANK
jgi:hypothetical protein